MKKIHITILLTVYYILGILAHENDLFLPFAICGLFALGIISIKYKMKAIYIFICYLFFLLAFFNSSIQIKNNDPLSYFAGKKLTIEGTISSIPSTGIFDKTRFFVNVDKIFENDKNETYENIKAKTFVTINEINENDTKYEIGDRIKVYGKIKKPYKVGNPNQFDYGKYLKYKNTFTYLQVKSADCEKIGPPVSKKWKFLQTVNIQRHKIIEIQSRYIKSPNLEILGGVVFGDDAVNPPADIKDEFVTAGILHILAASGMNVSFIFTMMAAVLGLLRLPWRTTSLIGAITVLIYAAMTGFPPSIVRAVIMLEFVVLGQIINREANSLSLLSFSALLMLIFQPAMLFNISFQLSFVVTLGIVLFAPLIYEYLTNLGHHWNKGVVLFIPLIAQIFVIPLQMFYFQTFSTYSLIVNILILPFLTVISFVGFISSVLNIFAPIADISTHLFSYILNPCITCLLWISHLFSNLGHALIETYKMHLLQIIFYYVVIIYFYFALKNVIRDKNPDIKIFAKKCLFSAIFILILCLSFIRIPNKNFEVVFFDVGNSDCILIKSPANKYFVIDTGKLGYKTSYSQIDNILIPYLKEKRVKDIEYLIITHFDADHAGGATTLLNNYSVKNVIMPKNVEDVHLGHVIENQIKENQIPYSLVKNGKTFYKENNFSLTNYYNESKNENESSIVTLADNNGYKVLFTADTTQSSVDKLPIEGKINSLKVGHHGAKKTLSRRFLETHKVDNAIVSVDLNNVYNHPATETIEALKAAKTNIFRTDLDNAVKITVLNNKEKVFLYTQEKDNWQKVIF